MNANIICYTSSLPSGGREIICLDKTTKETIKMIIITLEVHVERIRMGGSSKSV